MLRTGEKSKNGQGEMYKAQNEWLILNMKPFVSPSTLLSQLVKSIDSGAINTFDQLFWVWNPLLVRPNPRFSGPVSGDEIRERLSCQPGSPGFRSVDPVN